MSSCSSSRVMRREEPALPATGGARTRGALAEEPALPATGGARTRGALAEEPALPAAGGARTSRALGEEFASDIAEADFYIQAGLVEDARAILEAITMASPD